MFLVSKKNDWHQNNSNWSGYCKEHSSEIWVQFLHNLLRMRLKYEKLPNDGRQVMTRAQMILWVRWAENKRLQYVFSWKKKKKWAIFKCLHFLANKTYSLVQPTHFLNNFRQIPIHSNLKDWKAKWFTSLGARRPKGLNRLAKIGYDHVCLRKDN